MKSRYAVIAAIVLLLAVVSLFSSTYMVQEGQQAVVTQFGDPVRIVTEAGLHFKTPYIQEVHRLEKRLMPWDGAAESMQTRDKKRIFIDVWARWRISDAEMFFTALRSEQAGQKILDDLVDSAVRDVVARNNLIDVVRSTNETLVYENEEMSQMARGQETEQDLITTGRAEMENTILEQVTADLKKSNYGMELLAVRVKRVNYIQSVKDTVHERMRSERLRIAMLFQSEAEEEKNRIIGLTRKELDGIEGEMEQRAAEIRGEADAEVIQLTAEAYGRAPEFYTFLRRLEVLKQTLGRDTRLILTTDSDLFRLLTSPGQSVPGGSLSPVGGATVRP